MRVELRRIDAEGATQQTWSGETNADGRVKDLIEVQAQFKLIFAKPVPRKFRTNELHNSSACNVFWGYGESPPVTGSLKGKVGWLALIRLSYFL